MGEGGAAVTPSGPSTGRKVLAVVVTLVVLAIVFAGLLPQFADYSQAWSSLLTMSTLGAVAVVVTAVANMFIYVLPMTASVPGLRYWPAFAIRQTSFLISNTVPAGGAFGLGVQYAMLGDAGVGPTAATSAITVISVWNLLVTLALPAVGFVALVIDGSASSGLVTGAIIGAVAVVVLCAVLGLVLRSQRMAAALGRLGDRLSAPLARRTGNHQGWDLEGKVTGFRADTAELVARRWFPITWTSLLQQLAQFAVLFAALRGLGTGIDLAEALGAFGLARLGGFIPVTPGGLGTVDAALVALLVQFDVPQADAVAASLLWRAATFVPQVVVGLGTFVQWRRSRHRAEAAAPPAA